MECKNGLKRSGTEFLRCQTPVLRSGNGLFEHLKKELASGRPGLFPDKLEPDSYGLVYVGGEMSVASVLEACAKGCFPWTGSHPIPWFSPDPRLVIFPRRFHLSRSLAKLVRKQKFDIRFDENFENVMRYCASVPRNGKHETWITENMIGTYTMLHRLGVGHSVEVYENDRLCGGLYGLALGRAFFGESMFSLVPNTSKLALLVLCGRLARENYEFIDCQQVTPHLMRMGGVPISRREYMNRLKHALNYKTPYGKWR